jgi:hypothetical protein
MTLDKSQRSALRTAISILVVLAAFYFMGRSLYRSWHEVRGYFATLAPRWWFLPLPFAFFGLSLVIVAHAWQLILARFGERLSLGRSIRILAYSNFGKYMPGKVWALLGRVYMAKSAGVAERHSAASVFIETAYLLISALALFLVSLVFYPGLLAKTYFLLALIPVTLAMLYPPLFNRFVNFLLKLVHQPPVTFRLNLGQALVLFVLFVFSWIALGLGLYFLTLLLYPVKLSAMLVFPGAFSLSWIIGFIVIFAPGGLGVREGLFALLLDPVVHGGMNVVISLLSRVWITVSELLAFAVVFLLMRSEKGEGRREKG